jgi:hypothetical protein
MPGPECTVKFHWQRAPSPPLPPPLSNKALSSSVEIPVLVHSIFRGPFGEGLKDLSDEVKGNEVENYAVTFGLMSSVRCSDKCVSGAQRRISSPGLYAGQGGIGILGFEKGS